MIESINIQLPQPIFERLQRIANQTDRSIPDTVDTLVAQAESLPSVEDEVKREMMTLSGFPNEVLVLLAQNAMSNEYQSELSELNDKAQQKIGLSPQELERQSYLLDFYQKAILRRTYCLDILRSRGYDLSNLLQLPLAPVQ
ncbi:MAG: hypothetical protein AAF702_40215 [Chloroflexota bacterium]